ncbi:MAG TPA: response regulator [Verrucomicrobiae bacterium]|nr:response regulator [Verrucomicrobiae bacterium]
MTAQGKPRKLSVLVIDDEVDILDVVRKCLEDAGLSVRTAAGPRDGLKLYEDHWQDIGLVLLDYVMPEMTGDLVYECMRRVNPDVKVILLTACDDNVAKRMFEAGLRGYIQKPFYVDDLVSRVREEIDAL